MDLTKILKFIEFTNKFREIKRRLLANGENRPENDMEHSAQLAIFAWYINESEKLNFNSELLLKYALAHDLVETYAGDIPISVYKDKDFDRSEKKMKETSSLKRIEREFPKFKDMTNIIKNYENQIDPESRFIYSLDKLIPMLNVYTDGGRSWKHYNVDYKKLIEWKDASIQDENVLSFWKPLKQLLIKNKNKLFPSSEI